MSPGPARALLLALEDGTRVPVRRIRPSDRRRLREAFLRLSAESRYRRFHAYLSDLPDAMWRYLTEVDGRAHVAFVATHGDRIVGVARYICRPGDATTAEVAITVADDFQRRGLGHELFGVLVDAAVTRGVRTLLAHTLPENAAMHRLLCHFGSMRGHDPEGALLLDVG
jgi:GNAT superfamily N-acetyltransferase